MVLGHPPAHRTSISGPWPTRRSTTNKDPGTGLKVLWNTPARPSKMYARCNDRMGAACRAAFAFQHYCLADDRRIGWMPIYRPDLVFVGWEHGAHVQPAAEAENTESAQKCARHPGAR